MGAFFSCIEWYLYCIPSAVPLLSSQKEVGTTIESCSVIGFSGDWFVVVIGCV